MDKSSCISKSRSRSVATILVAAAALCVPQVGCLPRGTDEAAQFAGDSVDTAHVNFDALKSRVLGPRCIQCHAEFQNETGLQDDVVAGDPGASALFVAVSTGRMPKGGPPLASQQVEMVRDYIAQLPPAPIALEPTWKSLKQNLVRAYCIGCHNANQASDFDRPTLIFDNLDNVQAEAAQMFDEMDTGDMPPPESGKPAPPKAVVETFQQWIAGGFQP